jgi:hypothetical protein
MSSIPFKHVGITYHVGAQEAVSSYFEILKFLTEQISCTEERNHLQLFWQTPQSYKRKKRISNCPRQLTPGKLRKLQISNCPRQLTPGKLRTYGQLPSDDVSLIAVIILLRSV